MTNNDRLEALKISLPKAPKPVGAYVAYKKTGNLIFISGQVSFNSNGELIKGAKRVRFPDEFSHPPPIAVPIVSASNLSGNLHDGCLVAPTTAVIATTIREPASAPKMGTHAYPFHCVHRTIGCGEIGSGGSQTVPQYQTNARMSGAYNASQPSFCKNS